MTETPTILEICCCRNCEASGHEKETARPMTAEEIAQKEIDAAIWLEQQAQIEEQIKAKALAKASAEAKLTALGLTIEEIAAISGTKD